MTQSINQPLHINTSIRVYPSRSEMGQAGGCRAEEMLCSILESKGSARVVFAAAPSQNEVLEYLSKSDRVDWSRVDAFHMDEYIGLPPGSEQSFGSYLRDNLFGKADFRSVSYLDGNADPVAECARYSSLLLAAPIDLVMMGIGENGHIAFNDPHVADFEDPETVKRVELDRQCRMQQVNDGCFTTLDDVPTHALTLTISALMSARALVCTVPGSTKADAVRNMVRGPIDEKCPASILRMHSNCSCFFDVESASSLL